MILFSTILKINDSLTIDTFVQLVLEWNKTSKYKENSVPDVNWNGEYSKKFGNDKLSLEFAYYSEKHKSWQCSMRKLQMTQLFGIQIML